MAPQVKPKPKNVVEFDLEPVVGDTTGQTFTGSFSAKKKLSPLDELNRDDLNSKYLGGRDPSIASPRARKLAAILSELGVRLTEVPEWWREAALGEQIEDENVLAQVYEQTMAVELEFLKELKARAQKAQQALRDQGTLGDGSP